MTRTEAIELLQTAAAEFNTLYGSEVIPTGAEAPLFGRDSSLTSIDLVAFIAEVEYKLAEQYGIENALTDDRAMSQRNSPFRTLNALADYVVSLDGSSHG